jgi:hypothetical protein
MNEEKYGVEAYDYPSHALAGTAEPHHPFSWMPPAVTVASRPDTPHPYRGKCQADSDPLFFSVSISECEAGAVDDVISDL